jgi:hypothetical protein
MVEALGTAEERGTRNEGRGTREEERGERSEERGTREEGRSEGRTAPYGQASPMVEISLESISGCNRAT